jgi:putative colanic acid biosynthesis UDP-glucose lipid carrier transferase
VKPGLTGWAQVNGLRGETATLEEMRRRVGFDLWYVRQARFGLDLRILLATPGVVLGGRNAW